MNPTKSSLFILFIFAGICILSILASPSVWRQNKPSSTTGSPVGDEVGPESDQLILRKRNVPSRRQEGSSTAKPPSGLASGQISLRKRQVPPRPLRHQEGSSTTQIPSGPASGQLNIFKRNVPAANDQEEGSTTEQSFPSDQWLFIGCDGGPC